MKCLDIPLDKAAALDFEAIERLPQSRRSKWPHEVMIRFRTAREKDLVQSNAANLPSSGGKAGMRMSVPHHLLGLFKMFEVHGGRLKQEHGQGLKRAIKLDDLTMSIIMVVKFPNDQEWLRLHQFDIVRITKERTERESPFACRSRPTNRGDKMRLLLLKSPLKKQTRLPVVSTSEDETDGLSSCVHIDIGAESSSAA